MIEEKDKYIILAIPITLQDTGIKKRFLEKRYKLFLHKLQLKSLYEDSLNHKNNKKMMEDVN